MCQVVVSNPACGFLSSGFSQLVSFFFGGKFLAKSKLRSWDLEVMSHALNLCANSLNSESKPLLESKKMDSTPHCSRVVRITVIWSNPSKRLVAQNLWNWEKGSGAGGAEWFWFELSELAQSKIETSQKKKSNRGERSALFLSLCHSSLETAGDSKLGDVV